MGAIIGKMVFVQQVLSWFGRSVAPPESDENEERESEADAESNEEEKLETVTPASDLVTELNGNSMEITGYMVPPSNDENGALARFWPCNGLVSPAANDHRVI